MSLRTVSFPAKNPSEADWLLVGLHGWGANAEDLAGLAPYMPLPGFQMVFPDGPFPHPQVPLGRMWYSFPYGYDLRAPYNFENQADLQESRRLLREWLQSLPGETGIPLERTVLAGFSQGGAMTLDVGSSVPLAGQMVLSGYLHAPLQPMVTPRPLLLVHGQFDQIVVPEKAHQAKAALIDQGVEVKYHEIAMGHEILPDVIRLMADFCEDLRQSPGGASPSH
ncbi:MAG TPA: esterase [Trichocoleus sp.]